MLVKMNTARSACRRRIGPPATNAAITGQELRAMGINVDNVPVVDVNTNPLNRADGIRSFGDSTSRVSRFTSAAVHGFQGRVRRRRVGCRGRRAPRLC